MGEFADMTLGDIVDPIWEDPDEPDDGPPRRLKAIIYTIKKRGVWYTSTCLKGVFLEMKIQPEPTEDEWCEGEET